MNSCRGCRLFQLRMGFTQEYPFAAGFELFLENSVLLDQVGDRARLVKSYPASKRGKEELKLDCRSHLRSLSGVS